MLIKLVEPWSVEHFAGKSACNAHAHLYFKEHCGQRKLLLLE